MIVFNINVLNHCLYILSICISALAPRPLPRCFWPLAQPLQQQSTKPIEDGTCNWRTSVPAPSWKPICSIAAKNARKMTVWLGPFVRPMATSIARYAKWKRKHVAHAWFRFRWKTVLRRPIATATVTATRHSLCAGRTTNSIAANVRCVKRTAASICTWCPWNGAWQRSRSRDALACAHRTLSRYAAPTTKPTRTNAFWALRTVDRGTQCNWRTTAHVPGQKSRPTTIYTNHTHKYISSTIANDKITLHTYTRNTTDTK